MWIEELDNGKVKYFERYKDPLTEKWRKVSVTMEKANRQVDKKALIILQEKIDQKLAKYNFTELTYGQLFDKFYKNWVIGIKLSSIYTTRQQDNIIKKFIKDDVLIKNITCTTIQDMIDTLLHQGYSYESVRKVKSRLNSILKFAVKHKYLTTLETNLVEIPIPQETLEQQEQRINKYLEEFEVKKLIESIDAEKRNKNKYSNIIKIQFLTGMRYSEVVGLTLDNIDFDNKIIHIIGNYDHKHKIKTTAKTKGSRRSIQVSTTVIDAVLDQLKYNSRKYNPSSETFNKEKYIFISNKGEPISTASMINILHVHAAMVGIQKNVTTHIFRHSHISMLAEKGVPINVTMQRVGHADSKTTIEIYSHVTKQMEKELIDKLEIIKL